MNSKQSKTLAAVFRNPVSGTIVWADIESLLAATGCEVIEGPGSAVSFRFGETIEFFHRPHPAKEAKHYQVRAVRRFLTEIGVKP
jgi:HicA toxin of bacterial toxin-antitoxin,